MSDGLFREVSLKKLSSPEQLDELIKVTSTKAWLALIAIGCILISALVWGMFGSIPTKIDGDGILLNNGGVFSIHHNTTGQVIDIRYKVGDMVKKGDVVARIEVPELIEKINGLQASLNNMKDNQVLENQIKLLREELEYKSQIVSQIDGRVLNIDLNKGSVIQSGQPLITLEQSGEKVKMEAILYVPAEQGGKIMPGMEVQISPTIVKKEEFGFMLGRVTYISEYPATSQSMMQTLGNENLVSMLSKQGAPLLIRIDLISDTDTISGYKWSSPTGPPLSFRSGTLIHGAIIINREKPISKLVR